MTHPEDLDPTSDDWQRDEWWLQFQMMEDNFS